MPDTKPSTPSAPAQSPWSWLQERLVPRGTNLILWASYVILIAIMILYALNPPAGAGQFAYFSTLLALAFLLVINILWDDLRGMFSREHQGTWIFVWLSTALAFYTIIVGQAFISIYILFMIVAEANATLPPRPAITFSVFIAAAYMVMLLLLGYSQQDLVGSGLGVLIGMTFTITLSQVLLLYSEQTDRANRLLEQLQQANAALVEARQREKELVIAEERVRVARDLHDGLGHHLTALSIQLQAAEKLIPANPQMAVEAVHNARGEVQASLKEVRQSVAALRETPVNLHDLPEALRSMVEGFGERTGLQSRFETYGPPIDLSAAAAMTLYRAAQEGLTNVQKHAAGASQMTVRLAYSAAEVRLIVEDNGAQRPDVLQALEHTGGFGLAGLRERAHLLGGNLNCAAGDTGGFRLTVTLPLAGAGETGQPSTPGMENTSGNLPNQGEPQ